MPKKIKKIVIKGKEISPDLVKIIIKRVNAMPPNIKLAVLGEILTKEDILKAIRENTPLGREILEMEIDYYEDLIRS